MVMVGASASIVSPRSRPFRAANSRSLSAKMSVASCVCAAIVGAMVRTGRCRLATRGMGRRGHIMVWMGWACDAESGTAGRKASMLREREKVFVCVVRRRNRMDEGKVMDKQEICNMDLEMSGVGDCAGGIGVLIGTCAE